MKQAKRKRKPPSSVNQYIAKHLGEWVFILVGTLAIFLLLALLTYHHTDSAWSSTGDSSPVQNWVGTMGAWTADILLYMFGYIAYTLPLVLVFMGWRALYEQKEKGQFDKWIFLVQCFGFLIFLISACSLFSLHIPNSKELLPYSSGGVLGSVMGSLLFHLLNNIGSGLFLFALLLIGLTLTTGFSWLKMIIALWARVSAILKQKSLKKFFSLKVSLPSFDSGSEHKEETASLRPDSKLKLKTAPLTQGLKKQTALFEELAFKGLPPLSLLSDPPEMDRVSASPEALAQLSQLVEQKLREFDIEAKVAAVHPGPVITRLELNLAAGTKAAKLTSLSRDLARALSVVSVRIVEVIPGKSYVGLEIPNEQRELVFLKEILSAELYQRGLSPLTLALGKDIAGHPVTVDLAKMPHLLIAGTTGSGKSVGLNAMLLSFLYKNTAEDVRLILVDPKMLELSIYEGIPHLLIPVITDMKLAANALRWCIAEMERRYRLMAALGVRNLAGYNAKIYEAEKNKTPISDPFWTPPDLENHGSAPHLIRLPHIVILIDEFADMMIVVGKKVEELITRLAQKARAAGIHLILATQRPSVDVITGLIKANIPTRISFQVSSRIDSRTILDQQGAEQLLGHGDMLYLSPGNEMIRIHGAFVSDQEVHNVVKFLKEHTEPQYFNEILQSNNEVDEKGMYIEKNTNEPSELDPLFDEAVALIAKTRRASISSVQRQLRIGYNRAARLLEEMEKKGLVSSMGSNGLREVLIPAAPENSERF